MFWLSELSKNVSLEPSKLGFNYRKDVERILRDEVEGRWIESHGYIVFASSIMEIGEGRVQDGTARVVVPVRYRGITFSVSPGEIIDGTVDELTEARGWSSL
eukprot:GHVU01025945.1.p1 GENE.GHVU01025945.1~~GHVU01025945.1.p1  ORF type:complete len:102 (+),score=13.89 GHVU01025945.1:178-483(+)